MKEEIVKINTEFIKLDQFLKLACIVGSGGEAKKLITAGKLYVNEEIETRRGRKLISGDRVSYEEKSFIVKSEGSAETCS